MSDFDSHARDWDSNPMHWERSEAIAKAFIEMVSLDAGMTALEYGAGTGILSFLLSNRFSEITMMDSSQEMVKVMQEKIDKNGVSNLKPLFLDLEKSDFHKKFDIIFNQMVLHHVNDVDVILQKFHSLLNPGGCLAIADLYREDGSFHGSDVKLHHGFDPEQLINLLHNIGFRDGNYKNVFTLKRDNGKDYPVFLLVVKK